jgi:MFS family permease
LRALLLDRSVLVAAAAVAVAAFGWGIIEPLLPAHVGQSGASPTAVGAVFTVSSIAYGLSAPVVSRVADRLPVRSVITGGTVAMAAALPLLSLSDGAAAATAGLCLVSVCYAFMLNPTSAELGNAVDRRGMSCYGAVYAIYNIAYAVGQLASSAFASAASSWLSFLQILLCVSGAMVVFAMLLVLQKAPASEV